MKPFTLLIAILFAVCLNHNYAQNTWKKKASLGGVTRYNAVGFSIGSKGYLGTGGGAPSGNLKDFWEYDPATNVWTQKADFGGGPRALAVGFSIGNKGYIGTGYDGSYKNDFWEYDPATNAWTQKANFGGTARYGAVGFFIGSKGYIGTGYDVSYKNDFWEYDPATNAWTRKADFGGPARGVAVGFSIGSKGYIGTGRDDNDVFNDFWEYDPASNVWTKKAAFSGGAKLGATGFSIGSKGYIGLGYSDLNDFWEYDPSKNAWAKKANFGGGARAYATGFSIGDKGYIGAGSYPPGTAHKDFWEYTPDNTCLSPSGLMVVRVEDTAAVLKWHLSGANISNVWLRYRAVGDTVWLIRKKDTRITGLIKNGLMPNTTYQWQVRCLCTQDTSGWVKGPDFTTAASFAFSSTTSAITGSKLPGDIHVQIMPNPNKGNFTIRLQLPVRAAITTLALYNNMGEKVWQQDAGKISGAVNKNISLQDQLRAGIYMMVVQRNDVRLEQKLSVIK